MKEKIDLSNVPEHIAVIMDGNGRWAKQKGAQRVFGHQNAIKAVREVTEGAAELGVKYLTLYAFSTENWNRPKKEVYALMKLLVSTIKKETKTLHKNNIRLLSIGDKAQLPLDCRAELEEAIDATKENTGMNLVLALSYSGRWDIAAAVKNICLAYKEGEIELDQVDDLYIKSQLSTKDIPDPELMIRTSGEMRISNFLTWESAYTELFFTPTLWPDFRKDTLHEAILSYQARERRFGLTGDQLVK